MALAGTLEIQMVAGIARLQSDMNQAKTVVTSATKHIESAVASAKSALGALGVGLGVGYFVSLTKGAIDAADKINDLSKSTGIAVVELGKFKLATEQSGTTLEGLARGVKGLATAFAEHGDELRAAGISAKDTDGRMRQIADIFAKMPDGIEKTTLAVKLFGKSGMDLIPMLDMGAAGLDETAAKSAKYAAVLATLAPQADKFNDTIAELGMASKVASMAIINDALPAMSQIAAAMAQAAHESGMLKAAWVGLGGIGWEAIFKPAAVIIHGIRNDLEELNVKLLRLFGQEAEAKKVEAGIAARWKAISDMTTPPGESEAPKQFDTEAWVEQYKKMLAALGLERKKAGNDANKDLQKLLDIGTKGELDAQIARVKIWQDEQNAINDLRNAGFEEDAKLLDLGTKGEEDAALARAAAVKGEMEAINDARNSEFEADKRRQEERLRETKRQADEIDRLLGDAILHGFERGKGFARNFWDSMIDMAKTVVLRPVISAILSPVTGAVTSTLAGMGISGSANAGGIGSLFSAMSLPGMGGVPVTNTAGALASGSGYFGAGSAAGAISTAVPAAAVAAYYVGKGLGLFGGSDSYANTTGYRLSGTSGAGGFTGNMFALAQNEGTQYSDVTPASTTAQWGDALKMALAPIVTNITAVAGKLGLDASALGGSFSVDATGTTGADMLASAVSQVTEQMALALIPGLKDMQQAGESLAQTFDRITTAELALNAQERALDIKLMQAQGDAAGALAAQRQDELDAMDATLRPLQQLIYATEDWAAALKTASDAASSAVNTQISATQSAASAARSAADQYRNLATSLADAAGRIMGGGRGAAGGTLDAIFGTAMTGNAGALGALPQAAEDYVSALKLSARNAAELARGQAKAANILTQASTVSTGAANWQDNQAALLQAQVGALEAIQAQLSLPSPDAAVLTQQAGLLGTIAELLQAQTSQIVAGNAGQVLLMQDQTGQIILANALTTDQTGQVMLGNSWLGQQVGLLAAGNALTADGTGQLLAGSYAVRDGVGNLVNVTVDQAGRISQVGALIDAGININSATQIGEYLDAVSAAVAGNNTAEAAAVRAAIGVLRQTTADGLIAATEAAPTRSALATLQASTGGLLAQSIGVDSAAALQAVERATAIVQATTGLQGAIGAQTGSLLAGRYTVTDPQTGQLVTLTVDQTGKVAAGNVTLTSINGGQWGIQSLIGGQTAQVINGNLVLRDQAGLITSSNAILRDQSGVLTLGNALVGTQTGQIITGNATQDAIRSISALNTTYSEQQLAALVASGGVQSDSLAAIVIGNATIASLIQQFVGLQNQQARTAYNDAFTLAAQNIWASVQASGGTLSDFDSAMNVWRSEHPVPSFAVGTSYVPSTGPAMLHQGERVFTAAANDELVSEVRALRSEVVAMRKDTRKTSENIEAVANGQLSFSTVAG